MIFFICLSTLLVVQAPPPEAASRATLAQAGRSLVDSASDSAVARARAEGWLDHLAGITQEDLNAHLAEQATPAGRMAYLEGWTSGEHGLRRSPELDWEVMDLLAASHAEDPAARIHAWSAATSDPAQTWIPPEPTAMLVRRPFWNSVDTVADRIAAHGSTTNIVEMLEASTDAERPVVIAAVLAQDGRDRDPDIAAALADAMPEDHLVRGAVAQELAKRRASKALATFLLTYEDTLAVPGIYAQTIAALALDDPSAALEIGRGRDVMRRIPSRGSASVFGSLAVGLAASSPEEAFIDLQEAGQLDARLLWLLALADDVPVEKLDPAMERGPLTEVKSFRTLGPNMLVPLLANGVVDRDAAASVFAHLASNGRWELVDSFLNPNTTESDRPADTWLPYRLDILSRAFAIAEFPPENWNQLFEQLPRLRSIDAQMAGLHGIAEGYLTRHGDRPLPASVKRTLDEASIDIAING